MDAKRHDAKRKGRVLQPKMRDVITDKLFGEYSVTYWKGKKSIKTKLMN